MASEPLTRSQLIGYGTVCAVLTFFGMSGGGILGTLLAQPSGPMETAPVFGAFFGFGGGAMMGAALSMLRLGPGNGLKVTAAGVGIVVAAVLGVGLASACVFAVVAVLMGGLLLAVCGRH